MPSPSVTDPIQIIPIDNSYNNIRGTTTIGSSNNNNTTSNIVSGALDRLHYEDDPSVKYYSDKKIWIYLHKDR